MHVSVGVVLFDEPGYIFSILCFFFFQAEDGIRDLVRSRGLGDVYKRQTLDDLNEKRDQEIDRRAERADDQQADDGRPLLGLSLIHI